MVIPIARPLMLSSFYNIHVLPTDHQSHWPSGSGLGQVVDLGDVRVGESVEMSIHLPDTGKGRRCSCPGLFFAEFFFYRYELFILSPL